jgi:hypothetical protein
MNFEEARKKVMAFVCSECMRQDDCPNPEKRMDFSADRPCHYKRKIPKRRVKPEGQKVSGVV